MNYLITGGAGFIGLNYLEKMSLKYCNDCLICFDNLSYASNENELRKLIKNRNNIIFVKGDITNIKDVDILFKTYKIDYIVHFASETHVDRSFYLENLFYKTNVEGTNVLLNFASEYHVKRFHYVSTDEVYGMHELNDEKLFKEEDNLNPTNPYAKSKLLAELLVIKYHKENNLNITISRSCNNFGKYQNDEKLMPLIIKNAVDNKPIYLYGDGKNKREWISVDDNNEAIDYILHNGVNGEIYNISSGIEIENLSLAKIILNILNKDFSLIMFTKDRIIHDKRYGIDCSKLEALGFKLQKYHKKTLINLIKLYISTNFLKKFIKKTS